MSATCTTCEHWHALDAGCGSCELGEHEVQVGARGVVVYAPAWTVGGYTCVEHEPRKALNDAD